MLGACPHPGCVDIFSQKFKKKTAAFHLSEDNLKEIARIAKELKRSKSEIVDQLLRWGLERYKAEAKRKR